MKEIKNINNKSLANILALMYGLIGFVMAVIVAISTIINIILKSDFQGSVVLVTLFNVGAGLLLGILTSLITAGLGWIIGYIAAGLYNWFSKKVGGIKVEMTEADERVKEENKGETIKN